MSRKILAITGALIVCAAGWAYYSSPEAKAKRALGEDAKDPSSLVLRDVRSGNDESICGEVNGRNGFGAMGGFVRFVVWPTGVAFVEEGAAADKKYFEGIWSNYCG